MDQALDHLEFHTTSVKEICRLNEDSNDYIF